MRLIRVGGLLTLPLLVFALPADSFAAGPAWTYAVSPHFDLYTTESPGRARDAIIRFEQIRAFFVQASKSLRMPGYRVRIVAFRSENEYRPYSPVVGSAAYYQPGVHHDTIAMKGLGAEELPIAAHEFVHLVLHNSQAKPPLWLNEGLAELYSTLKPSGRNNLLVGDMIPGRVAALARLKLVNLEMLMAADQAALAGSGREGMAAFYAQSWGLTHMLALSDDYRPGFPQFLSEVFQGADAAATIRKVYRKSLADVSADLRTYLSGSMFKVFVYPFGLDKQAEQPEVRPATAVEWGTALADLYAGRRETVEKAKAAYSTLASQFPSAWEPTAGLAYASLATGDRDTAGRHFARAEELGSKDPRIFLHWAMYAPPGGLGERAAALFRKAVAMRPEDLEIRYRAGVGLAAAGHCSTAMEQLLTIKTITPDQAPSYLKAVIRCGPEAGFRPEAEAAAKQLLGMARTPAEKEDAERLARWVSTVSEARTRETVQAIEMPAERPSPEDGPATGPESGSATVRMRPLTEYETAEGRLVQVDCAGDGAKIWIQDQGRKSAFAIRHGAAITLLKEGKDVVDELVCGPQAQPPRVRVRYQDPPEGEPTVQGTVRVLEFL